MDPLDSIAGPQAPQETVERLRTDLPLYLQFGRYINRLLHGDLGTSFQTGRPVLEDILQYFPATIELATLALIISIIVGIPLAVLFAVRLHGSLRIRSDDGTCWISRTPAMAANVTNHIWSMKQLLTFPNWYD